MTSPRILKKHFSISLPLLMLVLIILCSSLVLDVNAASSGPRVGEVPEFLSEGLPASSTDAFLNGVLFKQLTVLDKTYWRTLEDQTKLLDKWFGRPLISSTIRDTKPMRKSSTDSMDVHAPPYMNLIYISSQSTTSAVRSSSAISRGRNDDIASNKTPQLHTDVALKDVVWQGQTQTTTTLRLSDTDHFKGTNQGILESSVIAPLRLHSITHRKQNISHFLRKDVYEASAYHGAQPHAEAPEPNRRFVKAQVQETHVVRNEYNTMIPITLYGTGTTIVSFKGHKDYVVNIVLQLRGRRYESSGFDHSCENMRLSAQLRSSLSPAYQEDRRDTSKFSPKMAAQSDFHTFETLDNPFGDRKSNRNDNKDVVKAKRFRVPFPKAHKFEDTDDFDETYESNQNRVWSSFAQLFDTSLLCEVLPSLSLRVSKVKEDRYFSLIIQSSIQSFMQNRFIDPDSILDKSNACSIQVYISQIPAKRLKMNQIIFAVVFPLIVLLVPLPFFLRRADIIQVASLGIDIVDCIWYPPYLLRKVIIVGAIRLKGAVQAAWHQRRRRALQKRLEMQQRALSERMNATMAVVENKPYGRDSRLPKGADIPLGLPMEPRQSEFAVPPFTLEMPQVTVMKNESLLKESGNEDHSVTLEAPPMQRHAEGDKGSRSPLSRLVATAEPATTAIVVKLASHSITEESQPPRLRREYDEAKDVCGDPPSPALPCKRSIEGGAPTKCASVIPFTGDGEGSPTSQELLFTTDPCCEGDGSDNEEDGHFCRICRDGEEDEALVAPCNCTGSVRWVHPSCLDHWRIESIKRNMNNVNTCEICKSPFNIKIRRSILIWQSCKSIVYGVILILACMICFMLTPLITYGVFGELSCVAEYHHVPYTAIYKLDGLMLSFFVYIEIILVVILARLIVYSWFRSSPEVEAYIAEVHVVPRFMTWRNVLKIALVTLVSIAQALSVGYLIKYFMYITSDIAWNWEASPLLGGMVFVLFIFLGIGASVSLREQWIQSRITRGRSVAVDVAVEDLNDNSNPHVNPRVEGAEVELTRADFELPSAPLGGGSASGNQSGSTNLLLHDSPNNSFLYRRPPLQHRSTHIHLSQ